MVDTSKLPISRVDELIDKLSEINNSIVNINTNITDINSSLLQLDSRLLTLESRRYITETYSNGDDWYRIWSDGWIEQSGQNTIDENSTKAVNLHITMLNTNYLVLVSQSSGSAIGDTEMGIGGIPTSVSQITIFSHYLNPNTSNFKWFVAGFKA